MASADLVAGAHVLASGQEESSQTPLQIIPASPFLSLRGDQEPGKTGSWVLTNRRALGFSGYVTYIVLVLRTI